MNNYNRREIVSCIDRIDQLRIMREAKGGDPTAPKVAKRPTQCLWNKIKLVRSPTNRAHTKLTKL